LGPAITGGRSQPLSTGAPAGDRPAPTRAAPPPAPAGTDRAAAHDVVVLAWPEQAAEVDRLRDLRVPRLLLVAADAEPPRGMDRLADWVRVPASETDVAARVVALMRRVGELADPAGQRPSVDGHGRIVFRDRWAALSPIETRLAKVLCDRFSEVVSERELRDHAWPLGGAMAPKPNALRVHLHRLRQRLGVLDLQIVSVRGQGVVLEPGGGPLGQVPIGQVG